MKIAIIALINKVLSAAGAVLSALFLLLPNSPFVYVMDLNAKWLEYVNFLFPVGVVIAHLELYLTAVAIYYVIRIALRWVNGIS